jgi:pilus assembly protein CpaE
MADYVVVDTTPILDDRVLQVLSESDDIVYVVGMDIPSVKNARLGLQALEAVQVPLQRVLLVLNRADSRVHLSARDVERSLRMKVDAALPSDALVPQSVNRGAPAVLEFERSRFAARMREIADLVVSRSGMARKEHG